MTRPTCAPSRLTIARTTMSPVGKLASGMLAIAMRLSSPGPPMIRMLPLIAAGPSSESASWSVAERFPFVTP